MKLTNRQKTRLFNHYGPWALVTGASSGIGLEISYQLASAGFSLVLCARNQQRLDELAKRLNDQFGTSTLVVVADLSDSDAVNRLITECSQMEIGLLVAAAGFGTSGEFLNTSVHQEVNMLQVNCESVLKLAHYFSQYFVTKGRGGLLFMSSMVAFQGVPHAANYAATKAYIQSLAEALHQELKPKGVDVLAAAPGPVASGFSQRANMKMNMSITPDKVGVPILRALGKRSTVLPGRLTKLLVYSLRTVPRWGKVKIMKAVMGGMTKHQRNTAISHS